MRATLILYRTVCIIFFFIFTAAGFCQAYNLKMRVFRLKHSSARSLYPVIEGLKSDEGKVSFDPQTNTLIVRDYPQNIKSISEVIESLDVVPRQVEIKVVIADVTDSVLEEIGMQTGQLIVPSGELNAVFGLLDTSDDSHIRSQMTVKTLSNHPAQIGVSKEEIFGQNVIIYRDSTYVSPITRSVGDSLEVLPVVNNDGTVTVTLRPSMSNLNEASLYERAVFTRVIMNDGDTIAIGGLDKTERSIHRQTSFLGIPLSRENLNEQKKVVMFLTTTILD
ncbi:MAG: hypothetical protein JSW40_02255 [Candidatus Omnitrophota bacterium]|nr:MAG: hypothetical protein JSW40_02255 [Candidatus Omnitrophota bacterium]